MCVSFYINVLFYFTILLNCECYYNIVKFLIKYYILKGILKFYF